MASTNVDLRVANTAVLDGHDSRRLWGIGTDLAEIGGLLRDVGNCFAEGVGRAHRRQPYLVEMSHIRLRLQPKNIAADWNGKNAFRTPPLVCGHPTPGGFGKCLHLDLTSVEKDSPRPGLKCGITNLHQIRGRLGNLQIVFHEIILRAGIRDDAYLLAEVVGVAGHIATEE